jgi:hypothetical protein
VFDYVRIEHPEDEPAPDPRAIDVAILDMNHGWPNLGHDSLVHAILEVACDLEAPLEGTGLHLRALSYDVRRGHVLPEAPGRVARTPHLHRSVDSTASECPGDRFSVYIGTGGPGHIDPATTASPRERKASARTRRGSRRSSGSSTRSAPTPTRRSWRCAIRSA